MKTGPRMFMELALFTLVRPSRAANQLLSLHPPVHTSVAIAMFAATIRILSHAAIYGFGEPWTTPFRAFGFVFATILLTAAVAFVGGRMMYGKGTLRELLAIVVWLELGMFVPATTYLAITEFRPQFDLFDWLFTLAFTIWVLWVYAHFYNQGHRLGSPVKAIGLSIASLAVTVLALEEFRRFYVRTVG